MCVGAGRITNAQVQSEKTTSIVRHVEIQCSVLLKCSELLPGHGRNERYYSTCVHELELHKTSKLNMDFPFPYICS